MTSSTNNCQKTQDAVFHKLDASAAGSSHLEHLDLQAFPQDVSLHLGTCATCQHYEVQLRQAIVGLQDLKALSEIPINPIQVSALAETSEGLADRVWSRLLAETNLGQMEAQQQAIETGEVVSIAKVRPSRVWWRQPVAPMAAAAILVVLAGWHFTELDTPSPLLASKPAYVSVDYELDGQKMTYDSADRILDPTWIATDSAIGSGDADGDRDAQRPFSQGVDRVHPKPPVEKVASSSRASSLDPEADNDPLSSWVGF